MNHKKTDNGMTVFSTDQNAHARTSGPTIVIMEATDINSGWKPARNAGGRFALDIYHAKNDESGRYLATVFLGQEARKTVERLPDGAWRVICFDHAQAHLLRAKIEERVRQDIGAHGNVRCVAHSLESTEFVAQDACRDRGAGQMDHRVPHGYTLRVPPSGQLVVMEHEVDGRVKAVTLWSLSPSDKIPTDKDFAALVKAPAKKAPAKKAPAKKAPAKKAAPKTPAAKAPAKK